MARGRGSDCPKFLKKTCAGWSESNASIGEPWEMNKVGSFVSDMQIMCNFLTVYSSGRLPVWDSDLQYAYSMATCDCPLLARLPYFGCRMKNTSGIAAKLIIIISLKSLLKLIMAACRVTSPLMMAKS